MPITAIYAALLTIIFFILSIRVIGRRRGATAAFGTGGNAGLERAIRVHGNFAEYVPIALLIIYFIEISGNHAWVVHVLGGALLAGRLIHAFGVSREPEDFRFRVTGVGVTFTVMLTAALLLLTEALLGHPVF